MSLLTFRTGAGERVGERWYMVGEAAGRSLVSEVASLIVLLQQAIGDDTLPKVTRDLLLARALAQAEVHGERMCRYLDDTPISMQVSAPR